MRYFTPAILLLSLSLIACTQTVDDPKVIADKYWQYLLAGNLSEAEKLVSTDSRQAFSTHSDRMTSITQLDNGETKTIVSTTITTINSDSNFSHTQTFNTVLVLQDGQWKIDAIQSTLPPPLSASEEKRQQTTEELSDSMRKNMESIDEAMTEGMQMLNEALSVGSKEMEQSLLHMMNELNNSMQESIDKMKQRRGQQEQAEPEQPPQTPQPDPRQGEGMI